MTARDSPDRESSAIEREPGFYWISLTDAREVALWDGESWIVVGSALSVPDEEVTVLGERLEPP